MDLKLKVPFWDISSVECLYLEKVDNPPIICKMAHEMTSLPYLFFGLAVLFLAWAITAVHGIYSVKEYDPSHAWPSRSYFAFFLSVVSTLGFFADVIRHWRLLLMDRGLLVVGVVMIAFAWLLYVIAENGYRSRRRPERDFKDPNSDK